MLLGHFICADFWACCWYFEIGGIPFGKVYNLGQWEDFAHREIC